MDLPEADAEPLHGPVNKSRKKAELTVIADALGLPYDAKTGVQKLVKDINAYLVKNPKLANQRRYQGLFAYRNGKTAGGKDGAKTSADKDIEDEDEGGKPQKDPSGAHKVLTDRQVPRDPPARTTRLNSSRIVAMPTQPQKRFSEPKTGLGPTTPLSTGDGEDVGSSNKEGIATNESMEDERRQSTRDSRQESVVVVLERQGSIHAEVEEVHVPDNAGIAIEHRIEGSESAAFVRLSQLLPIALTHASTPMKNKGGRLSRLGFTGDGARIPVGTIQSILNPHSEPGRYLRSAKVDSYRLDRMNGDDDTLVCRLFVEADSSARPSMSSQPVNAASAGTSSKSGHGAVFEDDTDSEPSSGTAPARTHARGGGGPATTVGPAERSALIKYLRKLIDAPDSPWKKAKKASHILPRVKAVEHAMRVLEDLGWEQSRGGYVIPKDYQDAGDLAGHKFIKEDVLVALQLKHSQAAGDAQLFKPEVIAQLSRLKAWYDDPQGPENAFFGTLSIGDFREWQKRELEKMRSSRSQGKKRGKDKGKKRARAESDDSDSGRNQRGKRVKHIDSDDIDDSDSDQ
ncbi:hypothetical protein DICSQDRAFT_175715 [Dichomitus squalens LYAD-421 SS1]|uniref:Uncharacterized protein n=1 Tax=Dichomitus squalens (strain LYAD-421) TaxID=732165 RepID=R7SIQ3_DICSQ|nr:uncharacterized protein DICSQDRAFT_175715 [Dichomitus squalens LYAD-421 SS1]EJF55595.1 hypothetical protein DICSQDRAFT_175715 [Dichomitus squalens LYAD-421 SS1]